MISRRRLVYYIVIYIYYVHECSASYPRTYPSPFREGAAVLSFRVVFVSGNASRADPFWRSPAYHAYIPARSRSVYTRGERVHASREVIYSRYVLYDFTGRYTAAAVAILRLTRYLLASKSKCDPVVNGPAIPCSDQVTQRPRRIFFPLDSHSRRASF